MIARVSSAFAALLVLANVAVSNGLIARDVNCACPTDLNGDSGALINQDPSYQCAYPTGSCLWLDASGDLLTVGQSNCPLNAPCPGGDSSSCACIPDLAGASGSLIDQFTSFQCAYPGGACLYDQLGSLLNTNQGNCKVSTSACTS